MTKKIFAVLLIMVCILTGCTPGKTADTPGKLDTSGDDQSTEQLKTEKGTTFPGSYTVPEGWVKAKDHSTSKKFFYVEAGHETDAMPDNISINIGSNRYDADEHIAFREAILRQLSAQLKNTQAELKGSGTNTKQDYPVYIFTIDEIDTGTVTKQYYIIGDHQYCLIHLTNYSGSDSANEAAQTIVDSFVWN